MAARNDGKGGRKQDKPIRDALLAAARQNPQALKRVAEKAWEMAMEGDLGYFKEIADRIDGKALVATSVDVTSNGETLSAGESRLIDLIAQIKGRADEAESVH